MISWMESYNGSVCFGRANKLKLFRNLGRNKPNFVTLFGHLLWGFRDHITTWDQVLSMAEFAYINSVNRCTGFSPFEAVIGVYSHLPIDLVPLPIKVWLSAEADNFIKHIQQIHDEIPHHNYKAHEDEHRHFLEFSRGDMVMVHIYLEWLPPGAKKKLHPCKRGPYKVLKKLSSMPILWSYH